MKRRRRKTMIAFAACGSHGLPWVHMQGPSAAVGQLAVFEKQEHAERVSASTVYRVKIIIELEPVKP